MDTIEKHAHIAPERYRQKRMTSFKNASGNIAEAFRTFHRAHPEVYGLLVSLAREARRSGVDRYSIGALYEVARWKMRIAKTGDFKLNNNYRSRYARLIMVQEPDLDGFFSVRDLKTL